MVNKYNAKKMPEIVKNYLRDLFVQNKIEKAVIEFSGSGDDGHVDGLNIYPENISSVTEDLVVIPQEVWDSLKKINIDLARFWPSGDHIYTSSARSHSIYNVIQGIMDFWICENNPVDWVNGEGGQGSCVLSLNKKKELSISINTFEWLREEGPTYSCKL